MSRLPRPHSSPDAKGLAPSLKRKVIPEEDDIDEQPAKKGSGFRPKPLQSSTNGTNASASTSNAGPKSTAAVMPRPLTRPRPPAAARPTRTRRERAASLHCAQALCRSPLPGPLHSAAPDVLMHLHKRLTTLESARTQDAECLSTLLESQATSSTGEGKEEGGNSTTGQRDLGSYHFVSGVDASYSASLAPYINSLTYAIEDSNTWFSKIPAWMIPGVNVRAEMFISALLRAILYSYDPTHSLDAYRKLDPTPLPKANYDSSPQPSWQVDSDPEIQVASVTINHLTAGLLKYFGASGRYQQAANLVEKIAAHEPEVSSLLTRADVILRQGLCRLGAHACTAGGQCRAQRVCHLREAHGGVLLTLNSCQMFTCNGRDAHRQFTPSRVHLPFHEILPNRMKTEDEEADPALQRLPAPSLRGTWVCAYALLTQLVAQIGWDELLKPAVCDGLHGVLGGGAWGTPSS
ncbi:Chs5p-Arf1p-binding proteins-domain-containing protein [Mycena galericulata]|nr:Chs5p-Arf1p-binding proteins-domain-containing protein [Mycena galericulata]